jgi:hypothetical protein
VVRREDRRGSGERVFGESRGFVWREERVCVEIGPWKRDFKNGEWVFGEWSFKWKGRLQKWSVGLWRVRGPHKEVHKEVPERTN